MSAKPDDIAQDVWDAAVAVGRTVCRNLDYDDVTVEVTAIARAILAERERCALLAGNWAINRRPIHPEVPFDQISEQSRSVCHMTASHIAAAIRKGGA